LPGSIADSTTKGTANRATNRCTTGYAKEIPDIAAAWPLPRFSAGTICDARAGFAGEL
jgi:hypothetical protein